MLEEPQFGRYRLVERLAGGGMAEIFLAKQQGDAGLERQVVLKTILPQFTQDPAMRSMMMDEARIGYSLRHRNIVQVIDVGNREDLLYIVMEYVEGVNLAELSSSTTSDKIRPGLVAYIGCEICAALDYAHRRAEDGDHLELVHRDVSPQNILLSTAGGEAN